MHRVSIVKVNDYSDLKRGISKALELIDYEFPDVDVVIIKPNLHNYIHPSTGDITSPETVSAVIDLLRENDNNIKVILAEADATAMLAKYAFKFLGYEKIAKEKNVNLFNISEGKSREVEVKVGRKKFLLPVSEELMSSFLINMPTLKAHPLPTISCCLKNIFGTIPKRRKIVYHPMLNEVIVGINNFITSDLCIADGIIGFGKHPVKLGVLIVGTNPVAVDAVAARCMGYNPKRIKHLRLAEKEGLGSIKKVEVVGEIEPEEVSKKFPKINPKICKIREKVLFGALRIYGKLTGDYIPYFD